MILMKKTFSDRVFNTINYTFLTFCLVIILFPLINVVSMSFSSPNAVAIGRVFLWPVEPSLEAYRTVISQPIIIRAFLNSILYAVTGTMINVVLTVMAAYPLSRKEIIGRNKVMLYFTFTMILNGGMIPTYLVIKSLGMIDKIWAMIIPNAMTVYFMIIARTFFKTSIPNELYESAELDGANDMNILFKIVLPLSKSIIAVLTLFYIVMHWNSYFDAMLYLRTPNLYNMQVVLRNTISSTMAMQSMMDITDESSRIMSQIEVLKYAMIVVATLPIMIFYPFVQKYFIKGVMIGSIKG